MSDVIFELFVKWNTSFDYVLCANSSISNKIISQVSNQNFGRMKSNVKTNDQNFRSSSVVMHPSTKTITKAYEDNYFKPTSNHQYSQNWTQKVTILNYVDGEFDFKNITFQKPNHQFGHISQFSYFLINNPKEILLMTINWWTEKACDQEQHVILNTFDKFKLKWKSELKIQEKFTNFHGCQFNTYSTIFMLPMIDEALLRNLLTFDQVTMMAPLLGLADFLDLFPKREAIEFEFMKIFGEKGNFVANNQQVFTGISKDAHLLILSICSSLLDGCPAIGNVFRQEEQVVAFIPCSFYSEYEKLMLPFDFSTWLTLLISLLVILLVFICINNLPINFLEENVPTKFIDVIAIIFGMSMTKMSSSNSIRFLITIFVIFCLILRTSYQGVFFTMMTSDMSPRSPESFKELNDRNYSLIVLGGIDENTQAFFHGLFNK